MGTVITIQVCYFSFLRQALLEGLLLFWYSLGVVDLFHPELPYSAGDMISMPASVKFILNVLDANPNKSVPSYLPFPV